MVNLRIKKNIVLNFLFFTILLINPSLYAQDHGHKDTILNLAYSPDGKRIISSSADGTVKLWSSDGEHLKTITDHSSWVRVIRVSNKGDIFASGGDDERVRIWTIDGEALRTIEGFKSNIDGIAFTQDDKNIVVAGNQCTTQLLDLHGTLIRTFTLSTPTYDHNGNLVQKTVENQLSAASVDISPDGRSVISSTSRDLYLWDLSATLTEHVATGEEAKLVRFSNDGRHILIASRYGVLVYSKDLKKRAHLKERISPKGGRAMAAFHPTKPVVAVVSDKKQIIIWNYKKGTRKRIDTNKLHSESLAYNPDGNIIAVGTNRGKIMLWNKNNEMLKMW